MSLCCEHCFEDSFLTKCIRENGVFGNCEFCDSTEVHCIDTHNLTDHFAPLISLFKPAERETQYTLADHFCDYWDIFADYEYGSERASRLLDEIRPHYVETGGLPVFEDEAGQHESGEDWSIKEEYRDNEPWLSFTSGILKANRFFLPESRSLNECLAEIGQYAGTKIHIGDVFYRGRVEESNVNVTYRDKLQIMAPPPDLAGDGRANAVGIPVLYVSNDHDTVISELRAWVGAHVAIVELKAIRELRVVDLTNARCLGSPFECSDIARILSLLRLMRTLDSAFARPLSNSDGKIHYVPTQYVASYFKAEGFDGIRYRSAMNRNGFNVALFDTTQSMEPSEPEYFEVVEVLYKTRKYIPRHLHPGYKATVAPEPY